VLTDFTGSKISLGLVILTGFRRGKIKLDELIKENLLIKDYKKDIQRTLRRNQNAYKGFCLSG
jgi:hypothetical protein